MLPFFCAAALALIVLGVEAQKYPQPWAGVDQHRYFEAAHAWASGDLNPARHHYLPFYPLLGAAFLWLTPWQPFLVPDLVCLLASLAIFLRIGRRLAPGWPPGALALCFTVAVLSGRTAVAVWVVPWSTTGSAPFQFLSMLLALRFAERPGVLRAALFGLCVAAIAGFRPSDAAVPLATGGCYAVWALLRARCGWRLRVACMFGWAAGLLAGAVPSLAAHLAVFGAQAGPYVGGSAAIGLEWRLLAMRWVMIVIGPRPLLPEGAGLVTALPWVAPGLAGLVLGVSTAGRCRPAVILVAATLALHWALYLAYRDLQPYGMWRYYNVHYFKWTFPFLVLWAAQLALAMVRRPQRLAAVASCLATVLMLAWRPVLRDGVTTQVPGSGLTLPAGAVRLDRAVALQLQGGWERLYFGRFTLHAEGQTFLNTRDFKILPTPAGALLLPLRRLPEGAAVLGVPPGIQAGSAVTVARQAIVFGLPCVFLNRLRAGCT